MSLTVKRGGKVVEASSFASLGARTAPVAAKPEPFSWNRIPAPNAKPKPCAYCGHDYLVPCTETQHQGCQNYEFVRAHGLPKKDTK